MIKITNKLELDRLLKNREIGKGTYNTGLTALKQGKPVYISGPGYDTPEECANQIINSLK